MNRKIVLSAVLASAATLATSTPAFAGSWFSHSHYCNCGHSGGSKSCGSTSSSTSTSGGTTTTSGGTPPPSGTTTTSTTSGGSSGGSSGGTSVPEPGVLGMMGLGLIGLAVARRRKTRR